jgi:hypothetical protein
MEQLRIGRHDVALFEFVVEAARVRLQDRKTVTYVSDSGDRHRTYPVMLGGEPADTFVTEDGCMMRKVLVVTSYEQGHLDDDQMTNRSAA